MNQVNLTGKIANDLKLKHTKKGRVQCVFNLAENLPVIRDGKIAKDYSLCVIYDEAAERLVNNQRRGSLIGIKGKIRKHQGKRCTYIKVEEIVDLNS